jgi:DNA-directed RNA polymerase subunit L
MKTKDNITMFTNLKTSENGRILEFDINGLETSIVNGLRRTVLNDILNIGFGYEPEKTIKINKNTTALHDEFLAHRISLLPVMLKEWIETPAKCELDDYVFRLIVDQKSQESKNGHVTTDDFRLFRIVEGKEEEIVQNCFPHEFTYKSPILITRFPHRDSVDQQLDIECKLTKGTHAKHACFSPTVICVSYENEDSSKSENVNSFMVESMGIWQPSMLIKKGFENLLWKCNHIIGVLQGGEGNKYDGNYMAIDYVLTNQSHTMGNMIQEWIYNHEFGNSTDGNELSHISYHEPHPLENSIIIRMVLKEDITDFQEYKETATRILINYIHSLKEHIDMCSQTWNNLKHPQKITLLE